MREHDKPDSLNDLVSAATDRVRQQQNQAAAVAARRPSPPRGKMILTAMLLVVMAGLFVHQYPRLLEPYALPDPNADSKVVEAELEGIAELIERYRTTEGKYPDSLDRLRLPGGLAAVVANHKLGYQVTDKAYVLDWKRPRWHAVLDGGTGQLKVTPANGVN